MTIEREPYCHIFSRAIANENSEGVWHVTLVPLL